jgi:hypothetical protein
LAAGETTCCRGHDLTAPGALQSGHLGSQWCRECRLIAYRETYRRNREEQEKQTQAFEERRRNLLPSRCEFLDAPDGWLRASRENGSYPRSGERAGKWLIFGSVEQVDSLWPAVRDATREGRLGGSAKAAVSSSPRATDPTQRVICVYTYDHQDVEDVRRVREVLRKQGVIWKIPYKCDADTLAGKYTVGGHTRISKYFE